MSKVEHPAHYGGENNPYEAIKVIEAWSLNFNLGNAVKYISRAGKKGDLVTNEQLLTQECDVLLPAALENVITTKNASQIKAKIICEGANGPTTAAADAILDDKGIFVIPDILANAGGVICAAMEYQGATRSAAFAAIAEKVGDNTAVTLEHARKRQVTPREAAAAIAGERVRQAMRTRRFRAF